MLLLMYPLKYGSLSVRRAWIEIIRRMPLIRFCPGSLSVRRAWIEITRDADWVRVYVSLSVRRAWIEMTQCRL